MANEQTQASGQFTPDDKKPFQHPKLPDPVARLRDIVELDVAPGVKWEVNGVTRQTLSLKRVAD